MAVFDRWEQFAEWMRVDPPDDRGRRQWVKDAYQDRLMPSLHATRPNLPDDLAQELDRVEREVTPVLDEQRDIDEGFRMLSDTEVEAIVVRLLRIADYMAAINPDGSAG
jgi:hypothetical protein